MGGVVSAARGRGTYGLTLLFALALVVAGTPGARAIDFLEGDVQVHGYIEEQIRGISRNFDEQMDLTQWKNILRIDTDAILIKNPIGPLDSVRSFMRLELSYDCVYTRACGIFPSVDVYGNRAAKLPDRLANARLQNFDGVIPLGAPYQALAGNRPGPLNEVYGFATLFGFANPDMVASHAPALYTFKDYLDYRFAQIKTPGPMDGLAVEPLGPWLPKNQIIPNAGLIHIANPFSSQDFNPIIPNLSTTTPPTVLSIGNFGKGALPFRPAPLIPSASQFGNLYTAQGIYYPSEGLVNYLHHGDPGPDMANYTQNQLAWNYTGSQNETYAFKEGYLHAEFLDGKAWLRVGKQLIVWGKTELFATTDQFNPRNDALSSLPSLEESRIPVWAARAVYNFYNVGPLEDVRIEGALNLDRFTPDDLGVCGMPYAVNPVCDKAFGLFAHGVSGVGLAGQTTPPNWWESSQGLQGGARLEFRWDRYSFALVDIYNYVRIPYANQDFTYSRNVDPFSGMPRAAERQGSCQFGGIDANGNAIAIGPGGCLTPSTALQLQSVNQTLFAMICSTTVGFSTLDSTACAQTVLGSTKLVSGLPLSFVLSHLFAGDPAFVNSSVIFGQLGASQPLPLVNLAPGSIPGTISLTNSLTPQQQALLGCGPYYHYTCDGFAGGKPQVQGGIDLLNMEASVVTQSFVGFEGTHPGWFANANTLIQPGTNGYVGGPVGTRFVSGIPGGLITLPGACGPPAPGYVCVGRKYNPSTDGTTNPALIGFGPNAFGYTPTGQPLTGQKFNSVMAAFSWNLEMILVTQSTGGTSQNGISFVNPIMAWDHHTFATASTNRCSYIRPELCSSVSSFMTVTGTLRNTIDAGGNGLFGRRDFVWDAGGEVNLQYQKRNVLGFSMDFAEDVTKSNWGIEFGWEQHLPFADNNEVNNLSKSDDLELSISVDRPTFINFLNQNRTFFFNSQFFISYLTNYHTSFQFPGPFDLLGTFTISTGYFQDRLLPSLTFVYDVFTNSGAALPEVQYRFTENFSFTLGIAQFLGRYRGETMALNPIATPGQNTGGDAYKTFYTPGLSLIKDRDEAYFKLRYTF